MIQYKINVWEELQKAGWNTNNLRVKKLIGQATISNIKSGKMVGMETINTICLLLRKQPGDILEEVPTDEEKIKYF